MCLKTKILQKWFFALHMVYACSHLWLWLHFPVALQYDERSCHHNAGKRAVWIGNPHAHIFSHISDIFFFFFLGTVRMCRCFAHLWRRLSQLEYGTRYTFCGERARSVTFTFWHVPGPKCSQKPWNPNHVPWLSIPAQYFFAKVPE